MVLERFSETMNQSINQSIKLVNVKIITIWLKNNAFPGKSSQFSWQQHKVKVELSSVCVRVQVNHLVWIV